MAGPKARIAALAICAGTVVPCNIANAFELDFIADTTRQSVAEALEAVSLLRSGADSETDPRDIVATANADYATLTNALYAKGHYSGVISIRIDGQEAADIAPLAIPQTVQRVVVRVETGPRFRFDRAEVSPIPEGTELPEGFAKGKTAESTLIREAAAAAVTAWRDAGHAKADLEEQSLVADHPRKRLSAALRIAPGPRLTFGNVNVIGESAVRAPAIRRIAGVPEGETFSPQQLSKAAQRLRRTGAFRSVTLQEAENPKFDNSLDTIVQVVDAKPRRFGFGAELTSLEGLTLSGFWMHRNISGAADRLRFEAEAGGIGGDSGGIDYLLGLNYRYPAVYGADTDAYLNARLEILDEPEFFSEQAEVEIGASRIISDTLTAEIGLSYRYSDVEDAFGKREFEVFSAPIALTWDTRDDVLNASEGHYLRAELTPFQETIRQNPGARAEFDGRVYRGFGADDKAVLAGRVQLATVSGPALDETPPDFLYFSGGGGSVRGQPYQSLTIGTDGDATGGQSFAGASLEARYTVRDNIQVVGFADFGWISADDLWQGDGVSHAGAGLGVRYITSFGPIRFDVGGPVSGDTGDGIQVYIGIGQAF